jgi:hypothetical protein
MKTTQRRRGKKLNGRPQRACSVPKGEAFFSKFVTSSGSKLEGSMFMIYDANRQFHNVAYCISNYRMIYSHHSILYGLTAIVGLGLLTFEVSRSHSGTPRSAELLRTNDRPVAETSPWQHKPLTRNRHPCLWRESNPQSHQGKPPRLRPRGHRDLLIPITGGLF